MSSYSPSPLIPFNSTRTSNEGFIAPPQDQLTQLGDTIRQLTAMLSEAVQTEHIQVDRASTLFGTWDQAVAQYRERTEHMIRELKGRTCSPSYATSNTAPFPMTQGGATQDMATNQDAMAYFAAHPSVELSPAPNLTSYSDAQEAELESEYDDPETPQMLPGNDASRTVQFTVNLELEGGSYRTRVRAKDSVRAKPLTNNLIVWPAWNVMPHREFLECISLKSLKEHKPAYVRLKHATQTEKDNYVKLWQWLRNNKRYAAGSWGNPPDKQPSMVNTLLVACAREKHLLAVVFPVTGIPEPVMRKLVQQCLKISSSTRPHIPPQYQQAAHIPEQPPAPAPAPQQHEQIFPPAMHPVELNWPQYGTNTGVVQPNHITPGMTRTGYGAEQGSDPNRSGPTRGEGHVRGPSAGVSADYRMNLGGSQGELNDVRHYANSWMTGGADMSYSEAAYRDNYYGYNQ